MYTNGSFEGNMWISWLEIVWNSGWILL